MVQMNADGEGWGFAEGARAFPPVPVRDPRRGFSPKARGCAVVGVTPGMVGKCVTTPKVVVPNDRTEGMLGLYIV